ncbi:tagaturonate reductase [Dubosiella newyorkensis]|jgi:tagaturonate reductase|uniref:tagaturonate reductase n=1 Tax=Dubosiella newyorkensis TaxID=1862672 RepID=UPI002352C399|nr:tagaturonate reductase [Dubosiella newyorkensis]MCI9042207.1 tagaturonate reductase [Dubosiella newyorkensis]
MKTLNYQTLKESNYDGFILEDAPVRVLQFGEGNFLRGFVDYFIDVMNEKANFNSKVTLVQPISQGAFRLKDIINEQQGLYTLYLQGFQDGKEVREKRVISTVKNCLNAYEDWDTVLELAKNKDLRFITCNTTEAGIVYDPSCQLNDTPAHSYPAKLTQFLYARWKQNLPGFIILACELIDNNGKELEKFVLQHAKDWNLEEEFIKWIQNENIFCSTLVDRIVTGYPRQEADHLNAENGYIDQTLDTGEIFGVWVIEGPQSIAKEFPFKEAGLPIILTDNHKPYKERKVRILNGAHTSMVLGAFLAGQTIVRDCMYDPTISAYLNKAIYEEIIPTLSLSKEDCEEFAHAVSERFKNPFIDHELLSISLNSTAKWKARVMPSLLGYVEKFGKLPKALSTSLASYIAFYRGKELTEDGLKAINPVTKKEYTIKDDAAVLEFYANNANRSNEELVSLVLSNEEFWGQDLSQIPGLEEEVLADLNLIDEKGAMEAMKACVE